MSCSLNFSFQDFNKNTDPLFPEIDNLLFSFDQLEESLSKDSLFPTEIETTFPRDETDSNKEEQSLRDISSPSSPIEPISISSSPLLIESEMQIPQLNLLNSPFDKSNPQNENENENENKDVNENQNTTENKNKNNKQIIIEEPKNQNKQTEEKKKRSKYIIKKVIKRKIKRKRKRQRKMKSSFKQVDTKMVRSKTELSEGAIEERQKLVKISNVKDVRKMDAKDKYLRRLEKNRISAKKAREKKKNYWSNLEKNYLIISQENIELKSQLQTKDTELKMLRHLLKQQQAFNNSNVYHYNNAGELLNSNKLDLEINDQILGFGKKKKSFGDTLKKFTTIPNHILQNIDEKDEQEQIDTLSSARHSKKEQQVIAGTLFLLFVFLGLVCNWSIPGLSLIGDDNDNTLTIDPNHFKRDFSGIPINIATHRGLVSFGNNLVPSSDSDSGAHYNYDYDCDYDYDSSFGNKCYNSHYTQSAIRSSEKKLQIEAPPSIRLITPETRTHEHMQAGAHTQTHTQTQTHAQQQLKENTHILNNSPKATTDMEYFNINEPLTTLENK
ncbi:cyclic-amp response element binding protein [Anaeramoeba flamelloides]|uniref:Cyclic-amp response element binding protein n=1 Tax=Anaeramoeba flamelloides TaxID=1746091 RepID=A0ABQ8Z2L3_9EUKA|nr:cyclic-amp response element binding protein [Anaeramoeba flamelloides]